jgi:hypothetical protein
MSSSFTFNFITTGNEYVYNITSNVVLHLYRCTHTVAILEFTDEENNKIVIPTGIKVYSKDYQTNEHILLDPVGNIYALCWTDDYVIEYNNNLLLNIKNNKTWEITT